ncbi:MAG TPA: hypothetical protein VFP05_11665 [Thermomicrobiales bacterium]|jgi:pimeloyl-ACP methyl ester carboxylesterase|nr:hypothetical protein [Thermomicrobiales bacterium]
MNETIQVAALHDGSELAVTVLGSGPAVLLPARIEPYDDATAETMRQWGAEPDLGSTLATALARNFTVVAADYEGHRMAHPAPDTLTPAHLAADLLAIASAANAERFAYYGYSWLGLAGLQLALRTDRLWALALGGFPPLDGPYAAMLAVTRAAHRAAIEQPSPATDLAEIEPGDWESAGISASGDQTMQFMTLYEALQSFDDASALPQLALPRLAFAGREDTIVYGPRWGDTTVEIAPPLAANRDRLIDAGWQVELLPGLDHTGAMRSEHVLPVLQPWLLAHRP